ncbi:LysE family translocator [Xenorhabdus griffiniae]|uniref:LysE family translocator n=2 Tax=Xenorhabdus griffiniae TaxID=351672 RepID=A0ABY9XJ44_9GAMM|nr:LysE family translocator [Xenorhabdus griffiniae]MBD1226778.1 LysE family translocator [Xenorhabdus griffiniae]WMV72964.1 LysE family translocator [Xenorhabdus griffiniae]WNH02643.1 LysE family translocator [Xenorhabdus griffiniae]
MIELFSIATVTILAVISPGADFAMITRNSLIYGRKSGIYSSLGISAGVLVHVFYTLVGIGVLINQTPSFFAIIRIVGALYLIYIGYNTFISKDISVDDDDKSETIGNFDSFKNGFFTNALNPKTTLFVLSVYTQIVSISTPLYTQILYGMFMSFSHLIWFSFVAYFLSNNKLREALLNKQKAINIVIGIVLVMLGLWLIFLQLI